MTLQKINVAPNGPEFSPVVMGWMNLAAWQLSQGELLKMIDACLTLGVTTFDHADIYGDYTGEALFGAALGADPSLRSKMELVTKCGIQLVSPNRPAHTIKQYDSSKAHILASVDRSLKNLQTDYIDLLLIHRPDPLMEADDTAAGLTAVREAGKVRHVGVSNFTPAQFDLLASRLDFPLVTNQVEFSVTHLDPIYDGTFDQCQQRRIAPMVWSPLGGGRIFREKSEQADRLRQTLSAVGAQVGGMAIDQVALAWLMRHPASPLPVLGTGKIERVEKAVEAAQLTLSREQWFTILKASVGEDVP